MGQRLNIEIIQNGETLANAYYHWSGYTSSSLRLTSLIIENVASIQHDNHTVRAVRLLETTGALLQPEELEKMKKLSEKEKFKVAISRNSGLISISKEGIEETREWEEGRVEINLDSETVHFDVLSKYDKNRFLHNFEKSEEELEKMPIRSFDCDDIPFPLFNQFASDVCQLIKDNIYVVRIDNEEILSFIE